MKKTKTNLFVVLFFLSLILIKCDGFGDKSNSNKVEEKLVLSSTYGINKYFFKGIYGIATDNNGHFFVADRSDNSVKKINSDGNVLLKFESNPNDIATDVSGNLYIATGNQEIEKYDANGNFLFKFGSSGSANGQFAETSSLILNPTGNIYVVDNILSRIQKFSPTGVYLASATPSIASDLKQIGIGSDGALWVTDFLNHRVLKYNLNLEYPSQFGVNGTGNGQLNGPYGLHVTPAGDIFVTELNGSERVQKFNLNGTYVSTIVNSLGYNSTDLAVDSLGRLLVVDVSGRVQRFLSNGTLDREFAAFGDKNSEFNFPQGAALDSSGNLYVTDSENDRVQKFNSSGAHVLSFGTKGSSDGQFDSPIGICVDPISGSIYVVDTNDRVQKFNPTGGFLLSFGLSGAQNGELDSPIDLKCDSLGNVFVLDKNNDRVQKFNSSGVFLLAFGSTGSSNGQFTNPRGMAINSSDDIYVVDSVNKKIQKFNSLGNFLFSFNTEQTPLNINQTAGIAVDRNGNIYLKSVTQKLLKFNSNGVYVNSFDLSVQTQGNPPYGLVIDSEGFFYSPDSHNHVVIKFNIQK